ncbi:MAG: macro domain-containing protein [Planctomycetes bacterium]|nr:macro domain-containing protein [Planctomycetota bacterium]
MRVVVSHGDILDEAVDVLVSTANVKLDMTGGVNGAILLRGGADVQAELRAHLTRVGRPWVPPGTVVTTGPGPLRVRHIVHAVAVSAFYESSIDLVRDVIASALAEAARLGARTVALPALATGYGPLSLEQFAQALSAALSGGAGAALDELRVVLAHAPQAERVRAVLGPAP